jgi:hypothetical protein
MGGCCEPQDQCIATPGILHKPRRGCGLYTTQVAHHHLSRCQDRQPHHALPKRHCLPLPTPLTSSAVVLKLAPQEATHRRHTATLTTATAAATSTSSSRPVRQDAPATAAAAAAGTLSATLACCSTCPRAPWCRSCSCCAPPAEGVLGDGPVSVPLPHLPPWVLPSQQRIHCRPHIRVDTPAAALQHLNRHVKGGGGGTLQDALLHPTALGLVITWWWWWW